MEHKITWSSLKSLNELKNLSYQYVDLNTSYKIWIQEGQDLYYCVVKKDDGSPLPDSDEEDFVNNYKDICNKPISPKDSEGKLYTRSESRPINKTTFFTMAGDSETVIGGGKELIWDFSNSDDDVTPSGVDYKRKQIDFTFNSEVNIKDGAIYFFDKLWGSYIDLKVVAPAGILAENEVPIGHFVNKHFMCGTNNLGDELNTEAASNNIPAGFIFRLQVTVPNNDITSKGYVSIEIYRPTTV